MNFKDFIKPTKGKIILFLILIVIFFIVLIFIAFTAGCYMGGEGCNFSAKIANIIFPVLIPFSYFGIKNILLRLVLNLIYWYLFSCLIVYIYNKRTDIKLGNLKKIKFKFKNLKKFFLNFIIKIKHLKINKKVLVLLLIVIILIGSFIIMKETNCELKDTNEVRDECYFNLAKETNDISFCEKIDMFVEECGYCASCYNISKKDLCFKEVAINSLDSEICEKATTEECFWTAENCFCSEVLIKDMCYKEIAIKLNNISLCEKISDMWHKGGCISATKLQPIEGPIIVKKAGGAISKEKATDIAKNTEEVQTFLEFYGKCEGCNPTYSENKTTLIGCVEYLVEESSQNIYVLEYWVSEACSFRYGSYQPQEKISITIDSRTGEILTKYPNIEYIRNPNHCQKDEDCICKSGSGLRFVGCGNFFHAPTHFAGSYKCERCKCISESCQTVE